MTTIKIQDYNNEEIIIRKNDKCSVAEIKDMILRALEKLDAKYPVPAMTVKGGEV